MTELSNDILYASLNQLSVGIIIIDEKQRLVYFNQWLSDYSGLQLSENEGKLLKDIFPQYQDSRLSGACESALTLGLPTRLSHTFNPTPLPLYQKNFLGDDTHRLQQQISIKKIATDSSKPLCQIVIDNVTHIVKKEHTLQRLADENKSQQKKAEIANIAKSQFLANMSHEIRTPINGVLGMLTLLADTQLSKTQRHFSKLATVSAETLLHLINDILDFSKIEAGKLDIENIEFNLPQCIAESVQAIAIKAQQKGLEVIIDTSALREEFVNGDPSRIKQIITNLLSNAVKFTDQGEICIRIELQEQSSTQFKLIATVIDTGIGIPEQKCTELFNAFTQVDTSTTREYGGTGLGLTIVKQLCQLMGGDISVTSQQGQGSQFSFHLGLSKSDRLTKPLQNFNEKPVLLIDTNINNSKNLSKQLSLWGLNTVTTSVSGQVTDKAVEEISIQCARIANKDFSVLMVDETLDIELLELIVKSLLKANIQGLNKTQLIMLTPMNSNESHLSLELKSLFKSDYVHKLTKPIITGSLYKALTSIFSFKENITKAVRSTPEALQQEKDKTISEQVKILLVEDNRINQEVALGLLRKMGLIADVAKNGVHALELIQQRQLSEPYQLILMDCQMPEMDGYQATRAIRTDGKYQPSAQVSIVAMTANTMTGDQEKCLAAGMDDYLAKPIKPSLLAEKVTHWLAR